MGLTRPVWRTKYSLNKKRWRKKSMGSRQFAVTALSILFASVSFGQSVTATLRGTVHDPGGAVIPNAVVTATNTEKGIERTVVTNESGNYVITQLPAQTYSIAISAP